MTEKQYNDIKQNFWIPQQEGDFINGLYMSKQEDVEPNKQMVYNIKTEDRGIVSVWGSTVLDSKMKLVSFGDDIKIIYLGKVAKEGKRAYKDFKIQKA